MKLRGSLKIAFNHNLNFEKARLAQVLITQHQMADLAICHVRAFYTIIMTA